MQDEARVQYLFLNFRYRTYLRLQTALVAALAAAGVLFFLFARNHEIWWLAQAWWICLLAAGLEVLETWLAVSRTKKQYQTDTAATAEEEPHE